MNYLPLIAISVSILGLLLQYFGVIVKLEARLVSLETKVELFWGMVGSQLPALLKRPTHLEMDMLLDKMTQNVLSHNEALALDGMLAEKIDVTDMGRAIVVMLLRTKLKMFLNENKK